MRLALSVLILFLLAGCGGPLIVGGCDPCCQGHAQPPLRSCHCSHPGDGVPVPEEHAK